MEFFYSRQNQQVPMLMGFMKILQEIGNPVHFIRCNNAGENKTLKKHKYNDGKIIKFKFTVRNAPQQNNKVKKAVATLYGRLRTLMSAGIH